MLRDLDEEASARIAQRLIRRLEDPFEIAGEAVYVSASIGVTRLDSCRLDDAPLDDPSLDDPSLAPSLDGPSLDEAQLGRAPRIDVIQLVQESDKALYEAKRNGRRQAVVFDAELRAQLSARSGLELALRRAVREDEIEAWGQPVYDLRTGEVAWVELLARWEATPGSFVPPSLFVPLAEEIGVIDDLGRRMLRHATEALARWQEHDVLRNAAVAVNVSAVHIMRDDLVADVGALVACHGLAADRLIVELTESHRLADVEHVSATFMALAGMGVRLAVDDFGTGYSSLGQLLALPVSIVKVDRSLTSGCERDEHRAGVVRAIRQLAASLGHVVVAEGVETEGERAAVARLGLDQAQGYLLCPPLPLAQLEEQLTRESSRARQTSS
jgi:EAL domain-containing protein (putative c-di-GMP-specific phosphodiesterase class I)